MHDALPLDECLFIWSVEKRLDRFEERIADGEGPGQRSPQYQSLTLDDARARLTAPPPFDHLVVCHGGTCAPNALLNDTGAFAAHVELGSLGLADRWADLAVAAWSIDGDFGTGYNTLFYDSYGVEPDIDASPTAACSGCSPNVARLVMERLPFPEGERRSPRSLRASEPDRGSFSTPAWAFSVMVLWAVITCVASTSRQWICCQSSVSSTWSQTCPTAGGARAIRRSPTGPPMARRSLRRYRTPWRQRPASEGGRVRGQHRHHVLVVPEAVQEVVVVRDDLLRRQGSAIGSAVGVGGQGDVIAQADRAPASSVNAVLGLQTGDDQVVTLFGVVHALQRCLEEGVTGALAVPQLA